MSRFPAARFLLSVAAPEQLPADAGAEVAVPGRSNAGKSSAINALTQRRNLARTSKIPGRTQLLNYFELAPARRLVDLPGYGYAEVPAVQRRTWPALLAALRERACLRGLLLVVDARRGLGSGDEALLAWASPHRVHVLLAKADQLKQAEAQRALAAAEAALGPRASVQLFSAHAGAGVPHAQELLAAWLK
jgi:GTP-binding protein